jgi:hypothetical protein
MKTKSESNAPFVPLALRQAHEAAVAHGFAKKTPALLKERGSLVHFPLRGNDPSYGRTPFTFTCTP